MAGTSRRPEPSPPRKSLRDKLVRTLLLVVATIGIATVVVVSVMTARSSAEHLRAVQQYIEEGIASKGRVLTENHALALRGLTLDNAFLDMQRLLDRAVKDDGDLVYGVYVSAERETLALARRSPGSVDSRAREAWRDLGLSEGELVTAKAQIKRTRRLGQDVLEVAAPVVDENGELLGTLRYGLSTKRMHDALLQAQAESTRQLRRSVVSIGLLVTVTVLFGLFVSRLQAVRITQPIGELTVAAQKLAAGDRTVQVTIRSEDELELLGASFNRMVADLDASYRTLEEANRTLEHKVSLRTHELGQKNRDMRLVLDNIDQGFVTLSPDGTMAVERSRQVSTWFGPGDGTQTFWHYLSAASPSFAESFEVAWSQLAEDFLPLEVCLAQLPERLTKGGRTWHFRYLPYFVGERLEGVLVAIADVTERLAREREDAEHFDLAQAFRRLVQDRAGFAVFLDESSAMVSAITTRQADGEPVQLKRTLHTLKGNTSSMGLSLIAGLCHTLETELAEQGETSDETLAALAARWRAISEQIASSGAIHARRTVEIPEREFATLLAKIADGSLARADLVRELRSFEGDAVEKRFRYLAERAVELARRLGKADLHVAIDSGGDLRVDGTLFAPFFSELIHVVRNAVDHGIETAAERVARHKPSAATLTLRAHLDARHLTFEVSDDGAGIDWAAIEQVAAARGLPHGSPAELLSALCEDGVSTRSDVSELSGRGVGMSAFRSRVKKLNGQLEVRSSPGVGTTWLIRFPAAQVRPALRAAPASTAPTGLRARAAGGSETR